MGATEDLSRGGTQADLVGNRVIVLLCGEYAIGDAGKPVGDYHPKGEMIMDWARIVALEVMKRSVILDVCVCIVELTAFSHELSDSKRQRAQGYYRPNTRSVESPWTVMGQAAEGSHWVCGSSGKY